MKKTRRAAIDMEGGVRSSRKGHEVGTIKQDYRGRKK